MLTEIYVRDKLRHLEAETVGDGGNTDAARVLAELARSSDTSEQFVKDWLVLQESDVYIVFDPRTGRYAILRRAV